MQTVQDMERDKTAQAIAAHLALVGTDVQACPLPRILEPCPRS